MTFAEALRSCFERYLTFSGRASRAEYWWFVLFWLLTYVTLSVVGALSLPPTLAGAVLMLFVLATALPLTAVGFRRLQDTGRTGWFSLTPIVGAAAASLGRLIGSPSLEFAGQCAEVGIAVILLVWYASEGDRGPNAFGPDPLGRGPRG